MKFLELTYHERRTNFRPSFSAHSRCLEKCREKYYNEEARRRILAAMEEGAKLSAMTAAPGIVGAETYNAYTSMPDVQVDADAQGIYEDALLEKSTEKDFGILISGARITDTSSAEAEKFAESYYEEIRHYSTDAKRISENLEIPQEDVERIKRYLFIDNSKFNEETGVWEPFGTDCAIAHSWQRLMIGKDIKPHDRTLILHELFEMEIKKQNPNISHYEAHSIATKKYNYRREANEYYASFEKHKKNR